MPPGKRNAGDAGPSWRKWGEPPTAPVEAPAQRRRWPVGFWALCIAVGIMAGLWFVGVAR